MSDPENSELETKQADAVDDTDDEDSSTPFDHPLFLPILLFLAMLWFAYDGWFTADEEMQQWQNFNRIGAGVLLFFTAWTTRTALKEMAHKRREREQ